MALVELEVNQFAFVESDGTLIKGRLERSRRGANYDHVEWATVAGSVLPVDLAPGPDETMRALRYEAEFLARELERVQVRTQHWRTRCEQAEARLQPLIDALAQREMTRPAHTIDVTNLSPETRTEILQNGWSVSTSTPRSRANTFEAEWAAASQDGSHAFRSARSPAADIIVAQSIAQAHQTIRERADQQFMAHMAEARAVEAAPEPEPEQAQEQAQSRIGALGRAWLVSHYLSAVVRLSTATTSPNIITRCNEHVRQALEASANLYPQMSERWLRVMGYPRREGFPPVETAAATCHDTIYFARNTRTLYWVRPADGFWHAAPTYVPFAPLSLPRSDAQPPTVDGSDSAPFTLPAGTVVPTQAVQGDSVVVSMPQVRPARTWRIHHAGNFDNTDGVAGLAFDRQVDAVMALVPDAELPDNFRGVVTFGDRDSFPERETLPDNAACWFYFARAAGDLYRVTPFRSGWQYSCIAHALVAPLPAASVTRPGGLQQMVNSWGHFNGSWGTRPAHFDHMRQPAPPPSPPIDPFATGRRKLLPLELHPLATQPQRLLPSEG